MALTFEQKKAVVAEVADVAKVAMAAVAAEYRGITVEEMTDLRFKARESAREGSFDQFHCEPIGRVAIP